MTLTLLRSLDPDLDRIGTLRFADHLDEFCKAGVCNTLHPVRSVGESVYESSIIGIIRCAA